MSLIQKFLSILPQDKYIIHGLSFSDPWLYDCAKQQQQLQQQQHKYPIHGITYSNLGYHQKSPTPETPFSAQPEQHVTDYKSPPRIPEQIHNTPLPAEPEIYNSHITSLQFRGNQLDMSYVGLHENEVEQNNKQKAQKEEIEKLQRVVNEQEKEIKMLEKKERARLNKERARLNKRQVRKGKNPFGLLTRGKK